MARSEFTGLMQIGDTVQSAWSQRLIDSLEMIHVAIGPEKPFESPSLLSLPACKEGRKCRLGSVHFSLSLLAGTGTALAVAGIGVNSPFQAVSGQSTESRSSEGDPTSGPFWPEEERPNRNRQPPEPANPRLRTYAFLVDCALLILLGLVGDAMINLIFPRPTGLPDERFQVELMRNQALGLILRLILLAAYAAYFLVARNGQTPGKALFRLRIIKLNGKRLTVMDALARNVIGYTISALVAGVGFMWAFWYDHRQTWHDKLVGTIVIRDPN